ncbi:DUF6308 family protein [Brevibacterium jeotgali]|uniref:Uncharacterized protein n=1 Tax=Brevibacterium jeotgali TaxID=1262550 RepID=A0A2H1L4F5_9MICO|nr:DUF6308 family protein [Brevibacterium jeotgali]TWB98615.1 hypothetical protein FB108_2509 [Brevibacterium jeotgali]SMY11784.1 hypothetical protein BJEO58_01372 [Brevibacterium jeotgali]
MSRKGFPEVEQQYIDHAREQALIALTSADTPQRLRRHYCVDTDFAGSSFTRITPNTSDAITTADLLATTMLSASVPAHSTRLLLDDKSTRKTVRRLLDALPDRRLEDAKAKHYRPMSDVYDFLKEILGRAGAADPNPWVTASKLAARKRPDLFPVRDAAVRGLLRVSELRDYGKDWRVFRTLMRDHDVSDALDTTIGALKSLETDCRVKADKERLRILDAALWAHATDLDPAPCVDHDSDS